MKTFIITLFALNSFALVDYTDSSEMIQVAPSSKAISSPTNTSRSAVRSESRSSGKKYIEFKSSFASHDFLIGGKAGTVDSLIFNGRIDTDYDLFLEFEYPMYSGKFTDQMLANSNEKGNPLVKLGLNWFQYGSSADALSVDLFLGGRFANSGDFATGRTDKLVGIETSKRFYNLALSIGYQLSLTGSSKNDQEQDVGNITALSSQIGWLVSHDIKFLITAANVTINESDDFNRSSFLGQKIKYSYVSPEMVLTLGQSIDLSLKGLFQTRRPKSSLISSDSRLWSTPGLYGNSLSAGLIFSI